MVNFIKTFWYISDFFWKTRQGLITAFIIILLLIFELAGVGISVCLNSWNVGFYNSIQQYNKALLIHQLIIFVVLMAAMISNFFISYLVGEFLIIYIRKPMTNFYTKKWLYTKCYFNSGEGTFDNPEERLDNDIDNFIRLSKTLFLGITRNICSFISFSIVLWGLSGNFHFEVFGIGITVYGYLFWVALFLAIINVLVVFKVGKPLKKLVYEKQKCEASFRYHLSSVRNNKLAISDGLAEKHEYISSRRNFRAIVLNFYALMFRRAKIDAVNSFFTQIYSLIGTILSLPRYFAKQISFGQMMQVNSAVMQTIFPVVYLCYVYETIAELRANMGRMRELREGISTSDFKKDLFVDRSQKEFLEVKNFSILNKDENQKLLKNVSFSLSKHGSIFISGRSGIGKSTLLRAICGINSEFEGTISYSLAPKICLFAHKPYFPEDDFKRAAFYPILSRIPSDEEFKEILKSLGIAYLAKFINTRNDWRNILSSGEQQKLSFCKLFVKCYDLILLDEATSNIDQVSEQKVYQMLKDKNLTYISAGHNKRVRNYHDKILELFND